jgi:hypothetical protein
MRHSQAAARQIGQWRAKEDNMTQEHTAASNRATVIRFSITQKKKYMRKTFSEKETAFRGPMYALTPPATYARAKSGLPPKQLADMTVQSGCLTCFLMTSGVRYSPSSIS